jgi:pyridoxine kinase
MHNPVPRVAAIHDLSGFGRASLTVIIPILSNMGIQVCPLPTAVLSTHTGGFEGYRLMDLTGHLKEMIAHWRELGLRFDAVYSGFLGSPAQVDIVADFIDHFSSGRRLVTVDPVIGDEGRPYGPMGPEMIREMKKLVTRADTITPNLTEAAFLLDEPYPDQMTEAEVKDWVLRLTDMGPRTVVITSVPSGQCADKSMVVAHDREDGRFWRVNCQYIPAYYPGTGDAFSSVLVGGLLTGDSLPIALDRAVQFVSQAIRASFGYTVPAKEGILLERVLPNLRAPITASSYEVFQ